MTFSIIIISPPVGGDLPTIVQHGKKEKVPTPFSFVDQRLSI